MSHFQRLPIPRIERSQIVGKIRFDEHPPLAHLRTGGHAGFDATAQLFGVKVEQLGGLLKIEGSHHSPSEALRYF